MKTIRIILPLFGLLAGCSYDYSESLRVLPQDSLVALLQSRLWALRATSPPRRIDFRPDVSPSPLVGLSRERVREVFGEPWTTQENHWRYGFFMLPEGSLGGGTELQLTFNDSGMVSDAGWIFSQ